MVSVFMPQAVMADDVLESGDLLTDGEDVSSGAVTELAEEIAKEQRKKFAKCRRKKLLQKKLQEKLRKREKQKKPEKSRGSPEKSRGRSCCKAPGNRELCSSV